MRQVIVFFIIVLTIPLYGQISLTESGNAPNASSMFDINADVNYNKGLLIPRVTFAQRTGTNFNPLAAAAQGLIVYQTDAGGAGQGFYYNISTTTTPNWVKLFGSTCNTANYVVKSDGTNGVCSQIFDNGTNVGINTASPGYKLDVQGGSLNVGTLYGPYVMYGTLGSFDTRATNPWPETYNMGVTSEFKANASNGLNDGGTYNSVLSIRQWSTGTDWSGGGVSQLGFTPNGNIWHRYSQTTGSWGPWKKLYDSGNGGIITCGNANYVVKSDGTNGVCSQIFDNGTNVGIGTAGPGYKLDVSGNIRATGAIYANANGALYFQGGDDASLNDINVANTIGVYGVQDPTVGSIKLGSNGGTISGYNGNVGIGTTGPGYKLSILGPSVANGTGQLQLTTPGSAQGERSALTLYSTFQGTGDNSPRRTADIIAGFQGGAWGNEYLSLNVGNNGAANDGAAITSEKMRILSNGNVGIGTTAPGYNLEIVAGATGGARVISGRTPADWTGALGVFQINATAAYLPSIAFHWPGYYASQLSLLDNGGLVAMTTDGSTGVPFYAQSFNAWSDINSKKDIYTLEKNDYEQCLNSIMQIHSIKYRFNNESEVVGNKDGSTYRKYKHIGVEAQSLPNEVYSELLNATSTGKGKDGLNYKGYGLGDMDGLLVAGIKAINLNQIEMQKKIDEQNKTIKEQQKLIEEIQKEIDALKTK